MGELVERHMESMVDEIQEMRRVRLYSDTETKAILKERRAYEDKINGPMKNEQDFKDYIKFERDVLRDIRLRRNKLKVSERKSGIEVRIMKRIKRLFEIAIQRFPSFEFSLTFFKFCKESNFNQSASLVIQNMIKNFSHLSDVWQVAASWFMKKDVKQALSLIHKGLIIHPYCRELYMQAIELELMARENDDWPTDPENAQKQDQICCQKIETYVDTMFRNINNYTCSVALLELLDSHEFTASIQAKIMEKLITQYCNVEQVWQILAEREKNGHHYPKVVNAPTSTKFRLTRCMEKFEEGLEKICPRKKGALWALYIDYLIDLNQKNGVCNVLVRNTLIKKFTQAMELNLLSERHYVIWAKLLTEEKDILEVVESGLQVLPRSVDLWKLKLRCMVIKDDVTEMNRAFKMGYLALKEKAVPLWTMIIRYHVLSSSNLTIENVYRDAVSQPKEIANLIKPDYIEWVALNKDIESTREVYKNLARIPPFCRELHAEMFKLETNEINLDPEALELPMKLTCEQFGREDADVWINLRNMYYQYHQLFQDANPAFDINVKIAEVKKQAEEALKGNGIMLADFRDKYESPVNILC